VNPGTAVGTAEKNVSLLLRQEMPGSVHIVGCDPSSTRIAQPCLRGLKQSGPMCPLIRNRMIARSCKTLARRAGIYVATSQYEPFGSGAGGSGAPPVCAIVASDIPLIPRTLGRRRNFLSQQ